MGLWKAKCVFFEQILPGDFLALLMCNYLSFKKKFQYMQHFLRERKVHISTFVLSKHRQKHCIFQTCTIGFFKNITNANLFCKKFAYSKYAHFPFSKRCTFFYDVLRKKMCMFEKCAYISIFLAIFCENQCAYFKQQHFTAQKNVYIYGKAVKFWRTTHIHTWVAPKGCQFACS